MIEWQNKFEAYIAQWPTSLALYKQLPPYLKLDCAYSMKWWVELGLVEEKA